MGIQHFAWMKVEKEYFSTSNPREKVKKGDSNERKHRKAKGNFRNIAFNWRLLLVCLFANFRHLVEKNIFSSQTYSVT